VRNLTSASCGPVVCVDRSPRFSPDGEWISFTAEIEGVAQVFLMDTDGGSVRQLTGDSVGAFFPAWSPDGRWLAYARQRAPGLGNGEGPWELISLEVGSGRREVLLETDGAAILSPVWAPEGDRVAFIAAGPDASANIAVVNADGSDHRTLAATTTALELFLDWR
jgi:TolB protein